MKRNVVSVSNQRLDLESEEEEEKEEPRGLDICPLCLNKGKRVFKKTMSNHVWPKYWKLIDEQGFFFCETRPCLIVYFNNDKSIYFGLNDLHSVVMHKLAIESLFRPVCYCMSVLEETILEELLVKQCCDSLEDIKAYTSANKGKSCVITNPSGRCCGKPIKEIIEWAREKREKADEEVLQEAEACCVAILEHADPESFRNISL